jgi:sarcosine oxidase delta subunit
MTASLTCPFCGSADIETVARWGGQLITSQLRCRGCNTYFEALRDTFDSEAGAATEAGSDGGP